MSWESLPRELLDLTFDHIEDLTDLRQLQLVCTKWTQAAYAKLYTSATVTEEKAIITFTGSMKDSTFEPWRHLKNLEVIGAYSPLTSLEAKDNVDELLNLVINNCKVLQTIDLEDVKFSTFLPQQDVDRQLERLNLLCCQINSGAMMQMSKCISHIGSMELHLGTMLRDDGTASFRFNIRMPYTTFGHISIYPGPANKYLVKLERTNIGGLSYYICNKLIFREVDESTYNAINDTTDDGYSKREDCIAFDIHCRDLQSLTIPLLGERPSLIFNHNK